jgi:glycosyltransferase involved in cell wall biosynthesis
LALLKNADLLVQPALYEGFGMQILEAFAAGVPVACSNVSSLPEVAGDAAVYFNPLQVQDIQHTLQSVLLDASLRHALAEKGKLRLQQFSWQKCAQETLAVLSA